MKKRTSKVCAVLLSAAMVSGFTTSAFAAATNSGDVNIGVGVNNPIINVALPTFADIALDPFSVGDGAGAGLEGIQVASDEYDIINGSAFPIFVSYSLDVITTANVKLFEKTDFNYENPNALPTPTVANAGTIDFATLLPGQNEMSVVTKDAFFGVVAPNAITWDTSVVPAAVTKTYTTYDGTNMVKTDASTVIGTDIAAAPAIGLDGKLSFAFALNKAVPDTTPAADPDYPIMTDDEAHFRFYGQMNAYAPWEDNDIMIKGVYRLSQLQLPSFLTSSTGTTLKHGDNMFAVVPFTVDPLFGSKAKGVLQTALGKTTAAAVKLDIYFGGFETVNELEVHLPGTDYATATPVTTVTVGDITVDAVNGTLELPASLITALNTTPATAKLGQTVVLVLTLEDAANNTKTITLSAAIPATLS